MMDYIAHISNDGREQSVELHNFGVAKLASEFAEPFGMDAEAYQAGAVHDDGKRSREFLHRILDNGPKVDHSTAGAFELGTVNDLAGSFCVLGHHTGLPDMGGQGDTEAEPTWFGRMRRASLGHIPKWEPQSHKLTHGSAVNLSGVEGFSLAFQIRMLYSCLVDADFLDTERFMKGTEREHKCADMPALLNKFKSYISKKWPAPETDLDASRQEILENCIQKGAKMRPGLYSLTVPTGGGKTTSSLGFSLEHAVTFGKSHIIYVVPYTSIIEQNAQVFRDILGAENVLEHHSNYEGRPGEPASEFEMEQLAAENWDRPVVVTTAVRFFEALYANKSSLCRRLHNIANSVIIFDEAQMMPVEHLTPCVRAIEELVNRYKVTAVLCSATCPALDTLFRHQDITELQPNKLKLYETLRRTSLRVMEQELSADGIACRMAGEKQVMCVVNTRQAAKEVYDALPPEGRYHLSTLMYPKHRRKILQEVKEQLDSHQPVRLVATSLVEAGVDIDFPTVFRELAGLDSIIQAAGRCNREGKNPADQSVVYIFRREGSSPQSLRMNIAATNHVIETYRENIDSLDAIAAFFRELYRLYGTQNMDRDRAVAAFEQGTPCPLPFRTVAERFHYIQGDTCTVYIPTEDSTPLIAQAVEGKADRKTYRALGQYGVPIPRRKFSDMVQYGLVRQIGEGSGTILDTNQYSQKTGLSLSYEGGLAQFA